MWTLGGDKINRRLVDTYIRPKKGDKLLDIGCGPADILDFLPDVEYCGFDMDERYIEAAQKRFGKRGRFICKMVSKEAIDNSTMFDIIVAKGVLHHLNDLEAEEMFELAQKHLKSGGRLITYDGCYVPGQSQFARLLLSKDRGRYIRTEDEYLKISKKCFENVSGTIRHDLLRFPYTIIIMECTK